MEKSWDVNEDAKSLEADASTKRAVAIGELRILTGVYKLSDHEQRLVDIAVDRAKREIIDALCRSGAI